MIIINQLIQWNKLFYNATDVVFTRVTSKKFNEIIAYGGNNLLVCIAKTQYSLSDDPQLLGRSTDFILTIRNLHLASGAGIVIVYAGEIMTTPDLPKGPATERLGVYKVGKIYGLF